MVPGAVGPPAKREASAAPFLFWSVILLVAMEAVGFLYTRNPAHWTDFRAYYAAETMIRTEPGNLYNLTRQAQVQDAVVGHAFLVPFIHPSYEPFVFAPFSLLPYRAAYLAFIAFNSFLLVAVFFAARSTFSAKIPRLQPRPGLMLVFFPAIAAAICFGQDSIVFLLLCGLAWRQLEKGKDVSAGCLLALALFKFQLAIPIALLTAARRGWRFSAGFLATALAVFAVSVAIVGKAGIASLVQLLSAASLVHSQTAVTQHSLGIHPVTMPNLTGLLYVAGTRFLAPHAAFVVVLLASVAVFLWTLYSSRREPQDDIAFAMAIICSVLVSYHFYLYDISLLVLPIALLAKRVHYVVLLTLFWFPEISFLILRTRGSSLYAIPLLALLIYLGSNPGERSTAPAATPLYT